MNGQVKRRGRDDPEVRKAQILDTAIGIIGERGYYGLAVQDLAQRCGLTTGGLLYHFKTKEELLLAVLGEYERRTEATLKALIDGLTTQSSCQETGLDFAVRLLRAMMEQAVAQPELERLFMALQAEAMHPTHPGYAYFNTFETRVMHGLARIVTGQTAEPVSAARHIWALMLGLTQQWLRAERQFDLLAEWDLAIAKLMQGGGMGAPR